MQRSVSTTWEYQQAPQPEHRAAAPGPCDSAPLTRYLLASITEAVLISDSRGRVTLMNPAAERLTGWSQNDATGQPIGSVLVIEEAAGSAPELLTRDGRRLWIEKQTLCLPDAASTITTFRDISEQVLCARENQRLSAELRRANDLLEQFAFLARHDVQEPLRVIAVYSQLLSRKLGERTDQETGEYLRYTIQGARRIESLMRDLLAYTETSGIETVPCLEPVDCNAAAEAALDELGAAIESSEAEVIRGQLPVVQAQKSHIVSLFRHLIANALSYRNGEPPRVRISATLRGNQWEFAIADNGIGIPARYHSHVFGIFKRLQHGGETDGTGMGLAICKRIVEQYQGKIWVNSSEGKGATFFFTMPASTSGETK